MRGDVLTTTPAQFQELWECNFLGAVSVTQAALEELTARQGRIVLVGSLASKVAPRYMGAYPASKFALAAYAQQLRLALAPRNVRVLLVCPGPLARDADDTRYEADDPTVPAEARGPGGGARIGTIATNDMAARILRASAKGKRDLIVPARARLLFALSQLSPRLGDWLLARKTPVEDVSTDLGVSLDDSKHKKKDPVGPAR